MLALAVGKGSQGTAPAAFSFLLLELSNQRASVSRIFQSY